MNKREYCFTFDLKKPWGVSPLFFGMVQVIWLIATLGVYSEAALAGYGNFELVLILAFIPTYGLAFFEIHRWIKWGWLIKAIQNACSTNKMIVLSTPPYRTIFGYMRREIAPSFDIYKRGNGTYELKPNSNGCPNFDTGLMNELIRELPSYIVYVKRGVPFIIEIENKKKGGQHLQDDNFL